MNTPSEPVPVLFLQRNATHTGAPESLLNLLRYLDRDRFTPYVVCGHEGWLTDELRREGFPVDVVAMPGWSKPKSLLSFRRTVREIASLHRQTGIRIVHGNEHILSPYVVFIARALRAGRVCHVRVNTLTRRRVWEYLYPWLDRIVVISRDAGRDLLTSRFTRHKTRVIYNGVRSRLLQEPTTGDSLRAELGLNAEHSIVLNVGTVCSGKNQLWLLSVMRALQERVPGVQLVLVGDADGDYRHQMEKTAETLGVAGRVHFLGIRHDVPRLLAEADVLAFPTRYEGGPPRAVLEAMSMRVPVVAAEIAPLREGLVTGESGVLVPLGDLTGWVQALNRVLSHPETSRRLAEGARRRLEQCFVAEQTSAHVGALYQDLLEGRPHRPGLLLQPVPGCSTVAQTKTSVETSCISD